MWNTSFLCIYTFYVFILIYLLHTTLNSSPIMLRVDSCYCAVQLISVRITVCLFVSSSYFRFIHYSVSIDPNVYINVDSVYCLTVLSPEVSSALRLDA